MEETPQYPIPKNQEIGLLDVLVTLAENLKLLIFWPLVVGSCVLAISFMLPQYYESVALLQAERLDSQNAPIGINAAAVASLMTSASVIDPVVTGLGLIADGDIEDARRRLREQIRPVVGRSDKLLTLTVSARSAPQAQTVAREILRQTFIQSRPKGSDLARLQKQLAAARSRAENAQAAVISLAKRLESQGTSLGNDVARSYSELLTATGVAQGQVSRLEAELQGLSEAQVVQEPTLPTKASQPRKGVLAVGATLASGLVLLLFVFARQALRSGAQNPDVGEKLARIRRAFGRK